MRSAEPEWFEFRVGKRSTSRSWTNPDCQPIEHISHVTHLAAAVQVLSAGSIKPGLIYDESILKKARILVVWLSPNDWTGAGGFRYGNVRFAFRWKAIVEGKRYYWVERVNYNVPAARILVSDHDHSSELAEYDPDVRQGPWWHDKSDDTHYWNGSGVCCLEVLYEGELPLSSAKAVDFVDLSITSIFDPGLITFFDPPG